MRLTTILIFVCAVMLSTHRLSATSVVFTTESLYEVIDQRSASLRLASLVAEDASQGIEVAKNSYRPDISASWQIGYLGDGYLTDRDFSSGMHVHNPHFVNNFALEAMQLIYTGGAVTQSVKLAELRKQLADLSVDENRQQVRFVLLSRLIDLNCLYRQRDVIDQNIELAQQLLALMADRYEQGVLLQNDITRYELQVANLKLQRDRLSESIQVINAAIANALGYDEGTEFNITIEDIDENYPVMPLADWQSTANSNSVAVGKAKLGIDMSKANLRFTESERLPHVGAFAYGQFNSPITIEVPVLNKNFMYWGFGLNVSYNLSSLFKTSRKMSQARVGILESEQQLLLVNEGLRDQVTQAYEALLTSQSQLRTQRYSLTLAEQNYEVVSSRFAEGMALVTDLVDAANVKIAAQTGVANAKSQITYCIYKLRYISNTL